MILGTSSVTPTATSSQIFVVIYLLLLIILVAVYLYLSACLTLTMSKEIPRLLCSICSYKTSVVVKTFLPFTLVFVTWLALLLLGGIYIDNFDANITYGEALYRSFLSSLTINTYPKNMHKITIPYGILLLLYRIIIMTLLSGLVGTAIQYATHRVKRKRFVFEGNDFIFSKGRYKIQNEPKKRVSAFYVNEGYGQDELNVKKKKNIYSRAGSNGKLAVITDNVEMTAVTKLNGT